MIISNTILLEFLLPVAPNLTSSWRSWFIREECFARGSNSGPTESAAEAAI